jgi:hypothetical protein
MFYFYSSGRRLLSVPVALLYFEFWKVIKTHSLHSSHLQVGSSAFRAGVGALTRMDSAAFLTSRFLSLPTVGADGGTTAILASRFQPSVGADHRMDPPPHSSSCIWICPFRGSRWTRIPYTESRFQPSVPVGADGPSYISISAFRHGPKLKKQKER